MPYTADISRSNPSAFLILIDQSGSMDDRMPSGKTKAQQVADVLNRTLATLITRCTKSEGTRNYFDIGVIGYGGKGVYNGFQGMLNNSIMHPISDIEEHPLEIETRKKKTDDGAGGILEQEIKFPVWFKPYADGGTPMYEALIKVAEELVKWCDAHPNSYPPTLIHITDGESTSTDGDPEKICNALHEISTEDGNILIFNLHVSSLGSNPIEFPNSEIELPGPFAKLLFRMSSPLPKHLIVYAQDKGFKVGAESRAFMFNADSLQLVEFFDIGTRASQLR